MLMRRWFFALIAAVNAGFAIANALEGSYVMMAINAGVAILCFCAFLESLMEGR